MEATGTADRPAAVPGAAEPSALVAEWIDQHGTAVLRLAYTFLLDRAQAEDVFQDVFLKAYHHADRLREPERIRPWLLQVTANRCRDLRRSPWWRRILPLKGEEERPGGSAPDPAVEAERSGVSRLVAQAVLTLPDGFREAVTLYYLEGLPAAEVARLLGIPEATVHTRLHRARKLLKEKLQAWEVEP
ncbi:MAG: RNA polymerase sigma factor [Bacillota bacterium]